MWQELIHLRVDAIFHAPTTDRDRREIVRTMVRAVIFEEPTDDEIRLRIVWQDGTPDEMVEVKLVPWMHRKIMEMAADGKQAGEIAQWLRPRAREPAGETLDRAHSAHADPAKTEGERRKGRLRRVKATAASR